MNLPELPELVAGFDWSGTSLGPRAAWGPGLRSVVDLVLHSFVPMVALLGQDRLQLYNDAYASLLGDRHPGSLGQTVADDWLERLAEQGALYTYQAVKLEDQPRLRRDHRLPGGQAEAYYTLNVSPLRVEISGVLISLEDTTSQVHLHRRIQASDAMRAHLAGVVDVQGVREVVDSAPPLPDVPFGRLFPSHFPDFPEALRGIALNRQPEVVLWPPTADDPQPALAVPLDGFAEGEATAVLLLGLSPLIPLDEVYRAFLHDYARLVVSALYRVHSLEQLALNRRLDEEREALTAFARFTEEASRTTDTLELARQAQTVLGQVLQNVDMAFYEAEGSVWKARIFSGNVPQALVERGKAGFPLATMNLPAAFRDGQVLFWNDGEVPDNTPEKSALPPQVYRSAALYPYLSGGQPSGILNVGIHEARPWTARERALILAVGRSLELAFERAEQTRRLDEERAALEAFTAFMEGVGRETDPHALAGLAIEVLHSRYPQGSAAYYEPEGDLWKARRWSRDLSADVIRQMQDGLPASAPSIAGALETGQATFQDHWQASQQYLRSAEPYRKVAALPLSVEGRIQGLLFVSHRYREVWLERDKALICALVRGLTLALERAGETRRLAQEREALAAFARFTEQAGQRSDILSLTAEAVDVLQSVLQVRSSGYFELREGRWTARHTVNPFAERAAREGWQADQPHLALPHQRREVMFFDNWDAAAEGQPQIGAYQALARYPLYPKDHPPGLLGMAKDTPVWTAREKAVFSAVGDSLRLAVERADMLRHLDLQRQRLSDLNAELGAFITRTARALEAPARALGEMLYRSESSLQLESTLRDEAARLEGVAQDLQQLSRLEQQDLELDLVPLGEVLRELQSELARNDIEWIIRPLPIVRGDRELLKQALRLVLHLALSDTRGASQIEIGSTENEGELLLSIWDDGPGLTPEEASTLFDLSVRSNQNVPLMPGGGLAQVRRILARHGGWAWAETHLRGARLVLALPYSQDLAGTETMFLQ